LFKTADLLEITADEHSQVVVMRPSADNSLTYYFLGAWEKEPEGITNKADFETYLKAEAQRLAQPLKIDYNK
jgi:unsaturated rhamnogalacturonyl hydrolase